MRKAATAQWQATEVPEAIEKTWGRVTKLATTIQGWLLVAKEDSI